jgi:hypothetical protein
MFLKYFVIAVPILMVAFFNPLISFLSIYTYCTSEMLPEQLKTVMAFVNNLYQQRAPIHENRIIKQEERMALAEKFNQLCEDTQNLFIENPITEEEIQAEIDAYRRGE